MLFSFSSCTIFFSFSIILVCNKNNNTQVSESITEEVAQFIISDVLTHALEAARQSKNTRKHRNKKHIGLKKKETKTYGLVSLILSL